eukprot:Lithocolla_globosa_v1_NODE_966_length_3014_cov_12.896249.p1 type:complete len:930 gc:universal NODE_966_length_3014_cov_12.896249:2799-10(-)
MAIVCLLLLLCCNVGVSLGGKVGDESDIDTDKFFEKRELEPDALFSEPKRVKTDDTGEFFFPCIGLDQQSNDPTINAPHPDTYFLSSLHSQLETARNDVKTLCQQLADSQVMQWYAHPPTFEERGIEQYVCETGPQLPETKEWSDSLMSLMENGKLEEAYPMLVKLLKDVCGNLLSKRNSWSNEVKELFASILMSGGPAVVKELTRAIGGPSSSPLYSRIYSQPSVSCVFDKNSLEAAAKVFGERGYFGPFCLAVDATACLPVCHLYGNRMVGFATHTPPLFDKPDDAVDFLTRDESDQLKKANQVNAFVLVPLSCKYAPVVVAVETVYPSDHSNVRDWENICASSNINIVGLGADGDSKVRKNWENRYNSKLNGKSPAFDRPGFFLTCDLAEAKDGKSLLFCFPDPRHLLKKLRNSILKCNRLLVVGSQTVKLDHCLAALDKSALECGLWRTDLFVRDKQNFDAAARIFMPRVRHCLNNLDIPTKGTRFFLWLGDTIKHIFFDVDMSIENRVMLAWETVTMLNLWREWLIVQKLKLKHHFITNELFRDLQIGLQSIVVTASMWKDNFAECPYLPWRFGSDECELFFSALRTAYRTTTNFTPKEILDFARRYNKQAVGKTNDVGSEHRVGSVLSIEELLVRGEERALRTCQVLGITDLLNKVGCIENNRVRAFTGVGLNEGDQDDGDDDIELQHLDEDGDDNSGDPDNDQLQMLAADSRPNEPTSFSDRTDTELMDELVNTHPAGIVMSCVSRAGVENTQQQESPSKDSVTNTRPELESSSDSVNEERDSSNRPVSQHEIGSPCVDEKKKTKQKLGARAVIGSDLPYDLEESASSFNGASGDTSGSRARWNLSKDGVVSPNYVIFNGKPVHISSLLSHIQGKVYAPTTDRPKRFFLALSCFYRRREADFASGTVAKRVATRHFGCISDG